MRTMKYPYELHIRMLDRDEKIHNIFYGDFKSLELVGRKAKILAGSDKVIDVNIYHKGDITVIKGSNLWEIK